jgi:predicted AlkP superfamily pyrophosphatase or phosphodiesterase
MALVAGCDDDDDGPRRKRGAVAADAAEVVADAAVVEPDAPEEEPDAAADVAQEEADAAEPVGPPQAPVVLISIDGLRADAIAIAGAKRLLAMMASGASSLSARTVTPSTTVPSHASMVSAVTPEVHGITWDHWVEEFIPVPTLFSLLAQAHRPAILVGGKDKLNQLVPPDCGRYMFVQGNEDVIAGRAISEMRQPFHFMMVHFPWVDLTGHSTGWLSQDYLAAVRAADAAVGKILDAAPPDTTVIVSADHGGHAYNHQGDDPIDYVIPWIIVGPKVRPGHALAAPISTVDTAATAAHVLGVKFPESATGRPVLEAFVE